MEHKLRTVSERLRGPKKSSGGPIGLRSLQEFLHNIDLFRLSSIQEIKLGLSNFFDSVPH